MVYTANVVSALIFATPDMCAPREALVEALWQYGEGHARGTKVLVLPRVSKSEAQSEPAPLVGEGTDDLMIALIGLGAGQAQPDGSTPVVDEIHSAWATKKPIVLAFSSDSDSKRDRELSELREKANQYEGTGTSSILENDAEVFVDAIVSEIYRRVVDLGLASLSPQRSPEASQVRVRVLSKGSDFYLQIVNTGLGDAKNVVLRWADRGPFVDAMEIPINSLVQGTRLERRAFVNTSDELQPDLIVEWDDETCGRQSLTQTIAFVR